MMKVIYDISSFRKAFFFLIIPLLVIIISFLIGITIYSVKSKKKDVRYHYNMNFYSLLLAIIVCSFLTAFSLGFSINFIKVIYSSHSVEQYQILYYLSFFFPLFPFVFLILFMILFYKNYMNKKRIYKMDDVLLLYDDDKENNKDEIEVI